MIQLIVSDLDGTLLNSDHQITKRTIRAIKQLQRKGVRLLINTEMNYFDTQQILETYDLQCDIACFGGSCIFDSYGKQLHASYIPSERIPESTVRMDYVFLVPRLDIKIILKMK